MAVTVLAAVLALATVDSSGVAKHSAAKIRVDGKPARSVLSARTQGGGLLYLMRSQGGIKYGHTHS